MNRRRARAGVFALGLAALALAACVQTPSAPTPGAQPKAAGQTPDGTVAAALALIGTVQSEAARDIPPDQFRPPSGERPQIDAAAAARMQIADYLAQGPRPWQPDALAGRVWKVDFTVAQDGSGTHTTVQAAIDAVPERTGASARVVIRLKRGIYRERVCVPVGKAPMTLLGDPTDASAAVIVSSAYGGQPKRAGVDVAHPCQPDVALPIVGTLGSATLIVAAPDFQAAHLTVANDVMERVRLGVGYPPGASESGGAQGVALTAQADRIQLEDVRLVGHQDTFHVRRPRVDAPARVYVHASLIAGDVDFIFGNATLVVDNSTVLSRGGRRRPPNGGHVLAPSTPAGVPLGFLVTRSRFLAEPGTPLANISLGRAWDEGVGRGQWQPGVSPNGQALIRDSLLGPHLALQAPWAASTSRRPFTAHGPQAARMAEYRNTVLTGEPLAREVLPVGGGWGAAAGGVIGGAMAAETDVLTVTDRAQLARALAPHARPRIVLVQGRIDLSVDDAERPLGFEAYREPDFSWDAYQRAFDPTTWGQRPPEGPMEEARRRSSRRQAERVVLKVPSNTTLLGLGDSAHIVNGGLLLERVEQVIVRNIRFSDAYDHFPAWDPRDNAAGEWNSEFDNLSLRGARWVWVDHCDFDDGDRPDALSTVRFGRPVQHHDGLLDITHQSNFISVSWNRFRDHEKAVLVGGSDRHTGDLGRLKVSFHHNLWQNLAERAPRVRFGEVHVFNNLYVAGTSGPYRFGYALGVGLESRLLSEHNAFEGLPELTPDRLIRVFRGTRFVDRGSTLNGHAVDLRSAHLSRRSDVALDTDVGWAPTVAPPVDHVSDVPDRVRKGAGVGRMPISTRPP